MRLKSSEVRLTDGPVLREGGSMSDITVKGVLARDANGDLIPEGGLYKVDKSQEVTIGKSTPDFQMGWRNSLSYKNIDLSFLFNGSFGGIVLAGTLPHLNAYGVSKASADARDAGGVLVNGKRYSPEKYYKRPTWLLLLRCNQRTPTRSITHLYLKRETILG